MNELNRKYRKSCIIWAVVCLIIGIILTCIMCKDYLPIGTMQDLDATPAHEITEGRGRVTVSYVYDYYSYWADSSGKETIRDYLVLAGTEDDPAYIGVELHGSKNDRAYQIMQDIWEIEENGGENYDDVDYFTLKGNVKRITGDDLKYHTEFLEDIAGYYDMSQEEINQWFVGYVLVQPQVGDGDFESYLVAFAGLALMLTSIILIGCAFFADPLKNIKAYAKSTGNEDLTMSYIERFYSTTPESYGMKVDDKYFMFTGKSKPDFCETKNVIWIHKYVLTRKSYFITVGHDYSIRIMLANGKMVQVSVKNEAEANIALEYLMKMIPDAIFGYSDELSRMFNNNRQQMISEVSRRREERMGSADFSTGATSYDTQL